MNDREKALNERFEKRARSMGLKTGSTPPPEVEEPRKESKGGALRLLILVVLLGVTAAGSYLYFNGGSESTDIAPVITPADPVRDGDQVFAELAERYAQCVALVVVVLPDGQGNAQQIPIGTAWAAGPKVFVTNAHVANPVEEIWESGGTVFLAINRNPSKRLKVTGTLSHPNYLNAGLDFDGRREAVSSHDVALLFTEESTDHYFEIAKPEEVLQLDSGYRVSYMGFPMEGMAGGGVNPRSPVATMQSGIVTSTTDFWLSNADPEKRHLVQHNMGAAGGASGSPLFNREGKVVAVLNAGNVGMALQASPSGYYYERIPSAVLVNFAQRADLIHDILEPEMLTETYRHQP